MIIINEYVRRHLLIIKLFHFRALLFRDAHNYKLLNIKKERITLQIYSTTNDYSGPNKVHIKQGRKVWREYRITSGHDKIDIHSGAQPGVTRRRA